MTEINKRDVLGRPLTHTEVDENWESIKQTIDISFQQHLVNLSNPHEVTSAHVGAVSQTDFDTHEGLPNPHGLTTTDIGALDASHIGAVNPHSVTPAMIGAALSTDVVRYLWKGEFVDEASLIIAHGAPQTGWAYKNTTDGITYYYQDTVWYVMNTDGLDGNTINYLGEFANAPAGAEFDVYRNTTDGIFYYHDGIVWQIMVQDGDPGSTGATGADGDSVYITYHDNIVGNPPATPTGDGTTDGWHTDFNASVVWMSQKIADNPSAGTWGTPLSVIGNDGADGDEGPTGSAGEYMRLVSEEGIFFVNYPQQTGGAAGPGNPVSYSYTPTEIHLVVETNVVGTPNWTPIGCTLNSGVDDYHKSVALASLGGNSCTITVTLGGHSQIITLTKINATSGTYIGSDGVFTGYLNATQVNAGNIATQRLLVDETFALSAGGAIQSTTYTPGSVGFSIDADGTAEFDSITARGHIESVSGTIGGWTLGATQLTGGAAFLDSVGIIKVAQGGSAEAGMSSVDSGDESTRFWAGDTYANRDTAPFRVEQGGTVHMDAGFIGGIQIAAIAANNTESIAARDVYVNVDSGNDSTGDGSSGAPYQTIARAIQEIPRILAHNYTISVKSDTDRFITEQVEITGIVGKGGRIRFTGLGSVGDLTIRGDGVTGHTVKVNDCTAIVDFQAIHVAHGTTGGECFKIEGSNVYFSSVTVGAFNAATDVYGIRSMYGSHCFFNSIGDNYFGGYTKCEWGVAVWYSGASGDGMGAGNIPVKPAGSGYLVVNGLVY